jgi:hypothetical protein
MNAYLFTGWMSHFQNGRLTDSCCSLIVYGGDQDASWKAFEDWMLSNPTPTKVERIVGAPMLDRLFTETDYVPLDWDEVAREAGGMLETSGADSDGLGYWVDCDLVVDPDNLSPDLEWLKRELPEDIRSGLNWSADKTYFFLISVLSPQTQTPPPELTEESEAEPPSSERAINLGFAERQESFPELVDKELAVLVRARNSVVAAWLWRKYAASTQLAQNHIRIEAWCGAISLQ